MNAQVFTTSTSAADASVMISCPASRAMPEHHLAIDEILRAAEAEEANFHD